MSAATLRVFVGLAFVLVLLAMLTGCATQSAYRPVVDPRSGDVARYERDVTECQGIAHGAPSYGSQGGLAAVSVAVSTLYGANVNEAHQRGIIIQCMFGRGWTVLR